MGLVHTFCRTELPLIARVKVSGGLKTTGRKQTARSKSCLPPPVSASRYLIGKACQKSIWQRTNMVSRGLAQKGEFGTQSQ